MNYQQLVKITGEALNSRTTGKQAHVHRFWESMEFRGHKKQELATDAQLHVNGLATINLYPSVLARPGNRAKESVLTEFGLYLYKQGGDEVKSIWENKLALPTAGQIFGVEQKLKDPALRQKFHTYRELVESFTTAVDRLVAANICDALLVNNVPYGDSIGVDIRTWGPSVEYCNRRRYHSIRPLTSLYAHREINDCFGRAFAGLVLIELGSVRESSTQAAFCDLIGCIIDKLR